MSPRKRVDISDAIRKYRRDLLAQSDESSRKLASILVKQERAILRRIAIEGDTPILRAQRVRVTSALHRIVLEGNADVARWLRGELPKGGLNGLGLQASAIKQAFGVTDWREVPSARIRDTFLSFEDAIRSGSILPGSDAELALKYAGKWTDRMGNALEKIQSKVVGATARGESWIEVANAIQDDLGMLKINGHQAIDVFARGYTRQVLTLIANKTSTRSAQMAGIDRFINAGVPDDRQSEECAEASAMDAMTLEEWNAHPVRSPPRHEENCRCLLMGVVSEVQEELVQEAVENV